MKFKFSLFFSIFSSIVVILYQIFQWSIVDIITPFLMFPLSLVLYGIFIIATIVALIVLFKNKYWKPITIQTITILLWFFFPFYQVILDLDFKMNKSEREEVIEMVENGTLKPNVSYNPDLISLPKDYQHLSKGGGEIVLKGNGQYILFYTFRGILDNYSGFVYSPNDQVPTQEVLGEDFIQIQKLAKNWYFVASN